LLICSYSLGNANRRNGEWGSEWTSTPERMTRYYIEYLDSVLTNMTYEKVKAYVATIRANIERMDRQSISKNAEEEFERYLKAAYPNYEYEVASMMKAQPFPAAITLNYDRSRLENFDNQTKQNENALADYRSELAALPTLDQLRSQLNTNQDELKKAEAQRNNQRIQ
jgi:di/tripeptidase